MEQSRRNSIVGLDEPVDPNGIVYTSNNLSVYHNSARGLVRLPLTQNDETKAYMLELDYFQNKFNLWDGQESCTIKSMLLASLVAVQEVGVAPSRGDNRLIHDSDDEVRYPTWKFGVRIWYNSDEQKSPSPVPQMMDRGRQASRPKNERESISLKLCSLEDRNALFRAIRNIIAMNRDGVCYTNLSGYNNSWVSPFEYEK